MNHILGLLDDMNLCVLALNEVSSISCTPSPGGVSSHFSNICPSCTVI